MKKVIVTNKKAAIVERFNLVGEPISIQELTKLLVEDGLWSKAERNRLWFRECERQVREALNDLDPDGCPHSVARVVQIEESDAEKVKVELRLQHEFWRPADIKNHVRRRVRQIRNDFEKLRKFIDYCSNRWPSIDWWDLVPIRFKDK